VGPPNLRHTSVTRRTLSICGLLLLSAFVKFGVLLYPAAFQVGRQCPAACSEWACWRNVAPGGRLRRWCPFRASDLSDSRAGTHSYSDRFSRIQAYVNRTIAAVHKNPAQINQKRILRRDFGGRDMYGNEQASIPFGVSSAARWETSLRCGSSRRPILTLGWDS
jgi:hypothetical protein